MKKNLIFDISILHKRIISMMGHNMSDIVSISKKNLDILNIYENKVSVGSNGSYEIIINDSMFTFENLHDFEIFIQNKINKIRIRKIKNIL